jgi:uncharacterized lipoprotein YmbA
MNFRGNSLFSQVGLSAVVAVVLAGLGGCQFTETSKYVSTPMEPKTVMVINTATGETVWTCDVPVGQQLDIGFKNRPDRAQELGYDEMTYGLSGVDSQTASRPSTVRVPPPPTRKIVWVMRPIPEAYDTAQK